MRVLLPGHHWYSCVDVASVLPIMTCLSYSTGVRLGSIVDRSVKTWVLGSVAGRRANRTIWVIRREIRNKLEKRCDTV